MHGKLHDLGPYPGAIDIDQTDDTFEGHVIELDETELIALDEFEDVVGGQYRRIRTRTIGGHDVWIYEYTGTLPLGRRVARWPDEA